jgi:pyruvate formate lyase activating enzyme
MKEAILYEKLSNDRVRCLACARRCNILKGFTGVCGIRGNVDGKLYLFVYGKIIASHIDPIEKKPLMHFYPGSKVLSIGTTGCNWMCQYCQNYDISQRRKVEGIDVTPEEVVDAALKNGCEGVTYTYNEPTIFIEFAHDIGILAHKHGLFNTFVSNGFMTPESIKMLSTFLDAITVDFKGNGEKKFMQKYIIVFGPEPIFQSLLELKKLGIHIEITDLIVPKIGDNIEEARKLCKWIFENLGPDTPIHFLRFHPDYKLMHIPHTPVKTLEKHCKVAKEEGLRYVYIGNVPGHPLENTYCPECGAIVIERFGFEIRGWYLDENNCCKNCGYKIPIVGKLGENAFESRFLPVFW